jgi:hypothetical protein
MKPSNMSKFVGASLIAASLAVVPLNLPASAQTQNDAANNGTDTQQTQQTRDVADTNDDFDWGWLGLLGLAGLAGLAGLKRKDNVHRVSNNPDVVVRSGSDYR